MPGSPPTSTAEAATSPPPSTRSSSSIPGHAGAAAVRWSRTSARFSNASFAGPRPGLAPLDKPGLGVGGFLDDRIPLAAGLAAAGPLAGDRTAGLADVAGVRFSQPDAVFRRHCEAAWPKQPQGSCGGTCRAALDCFAARAARNDTIWFMGWIRTNLPLRVGRLILSRGGVPGRTSACSRPGPEPRTRCAPAYRPRPGGSPAPSAGATSRHRLRRRPGRIPHPASRPPASRHGRMGSPGLAGRPSAPSAISIETPSRSSSARFCSGA